MSKYLIKNPTMRKVKNRGYTPVNVWRDGWYCGWVVKTGRKWQHIFLIADNAVRKLPIGSRKVKPI